MTRTIEIEVPEGSTETTIKLDGGTTLRVGRPRLARRPSSWAAQRPGWGAASRECNDVIADCIKPAISADGAGGLSGSERQRLRLAIVRLLGLESRWRALYGTTLTSEERFVAVVRWWLEEERAELLRGLRETRQRLITEASSKAGTAYKVADPTGRLLGFHRQTNQLTKPLGIAAMAAQIARPIAQMDLATELAFTPPKGVFGINSSVSNLVLSAGFDSTSTNSIRQMTQSLELGREAARLPGIGSVDQFAKLPTALLSGAAGRSGILGSSGELSATFAKHVQTLDWAGGAMPSALGITAALRGGGLAAGVLPTGLEITAMLRDQGLSAGTFPNTLGIAALLREGGRGLTNPTLGLLNSANTSLRTALSYRNLLGPYINGFQLDLVATFKRSPAGVIVIEFKRLWSEDPRWFLLRLLSPLQIPQLTEEREAVVEAVLDGLEGLVREGSLIESLRQSLFKLPFLDRFQLEAFEHGLEQASAGNWSPAVLCLISPFEGAMYARSNEAELIDDSPGGKLMAAELVIKRSGLPKDLERFAIQMVWGGQGNPFRHGRPQGASRDQTLWLLVGLIGWIDFVAGTEGMQRLADELHHPVRQALQPAGQARESLG